MHAGGGRSKLLSPGLHRLLTVAALSSALLLARRSLVSNVSRARLSRTAAGLFLFQAATDSSAIATVFISPPRAGSRPYRHSSASTKPYSRCTAIADIASDATVRAIRRPAHPDAWHRRCPCCSAGCPETRRCPTKGEHACVTMDQRWNRMDPCSARLASRPVIH